MRGRKKKERETLPFRVRRYVLASAPSSVRPYHIPTFTTLSIYLRTTQKNKADVVRRHGDHCDDVAKLTSGLSPHKHTFTKCPGTLTVQWVNDKNDERMLVMCEVTSEVDPLEVTHNLYNSLSGDNFLPSTQDTAASTDCPDGVDISLVGDTVFSELPKGKQSHRFAYSTPMPQVADGSNYMWVSKNTGETFSCHRTPALFDTLLPHPNRHGWFMGRANAKYDDADGVTRADVYMCRIDNPSEIKLDCNMIHQDVLMFEWAVNTEKDTVFLIAKGVGFIRIDNPDKNQASTHHTEIPNAETFQESADGSFVFVTTTPGGPEAFFERTLYISKDNGITFDKGVFPLKGRHMNFAVVDSSHGMAMVCVETYKTRFEGTALLEIKTNDGTKKNISAYRAAFTEAPAFSEGKAMYFDKANDEGCDWTDVDPMNLRKRIVVVRRGTCKFHEKAMLAQQAGAEALVVINSDDSYRLYMAAPDDAFEMPDIPVLIIAKEAGDAIVDEWTDSGGAAGSMLTLRPLEIEAVETTMWKATNLYTSDETGSRFSLSLSGVNYEGGGYFSKSFVDVFKVDSTAGTYMANYRDTKQDHDHATVVTVITNNYGAHWRPLTPPVNSRSKDSRPLHIALESSRAAHYIPLPRSEATAAGIIVANGWEDEHIPVGQEALDMARTYVSRDAGSTWRLLEVEEGKQADDEYAAFTGYHDYRILDHGSIIIFIPRKRSKHIAFSVDEGHGDVLTYSLSNLLRNEAMVFDGIITEPGSTTTKAYLYEHKSASGIPADSEWVGDVIDFAPLLGKKCKSTDYEDVPFVPNPDSDGCVLGERLKYKRRKDCIIEPCLNDLDYELVKSSEVSCECTDFDYKCSYGFVRKNAVGQRAACTRDFDAPCDIRAGESQVFKVYEKIPGDKCISGDTDTEFTQLFKMDSCNQQAVGLGKEVADAIGYLTVAAILAGLIFVLVLTLSPTARDKTMLYLGTEKGCLGSIGNFLQRFECFRQMAAAQVYNELSISAEPLTDGDLLSDVSDDDSEENVDDILFGLDDTADDL